MPAGRAHKEEKKNAVIFPKYEIKTPLPGPIAKIEKPVNPPSSYGGYLVNIPRPKEKGGK